MSHKLLWGVDLGGTKVECAVLDAETSEILCRKRVATEQQHGYTHIIEQIRGLVQEVVQAVGHSPRIIGVGMPGVHDPETGVMQRGNILCLNGMPFQADLQSQLGCRVRLGNDANCFALAETRMGIVKEIKPDASVVFGCVLGTGVGGGIVINGNVLEGHHGIGGEWGHIYLDDSGGECYCGNTGCVERIFSGTALEKYYAELSGNYLPLKDIAVREKEDKNAALTVNRLVTMFGKGIVQITNVLDPDVIVIGGGVSNINALFDRVEPEINRYIYSKAFTAVLSRPKLGDSAGVFGAALLTADLEEA